MNRLYDSFKTSDGVEIRTVSWLPDRAPKGVILLVHGLGEHSGRYAHVAKALNQANYAVYALDHRGHGNSDGLRGHFDSIHQPVDDLEVYYNKIKSLHGASPFFVYGHSMGALISLLFVQRHQDQLAGWISQGTPLNTDTAQSPILLPIAKFLNKVAPKMRLVPLDSKGLSKNPDVIADYKADPLNQNGAHRVSILSGIIFGGQEARKDLRKIKLPLLVLHGRDDSICPVSGSEMLYAQATSSDKTLKIYDGLFHEIHNEIEQEQVFSDIVAWLDAHVKSD
jgi:acylglycerol lipase